MARLLRIEFPGAIYHVTLRMLGDWKKETNQLFEDDRDRLRFLDRLGERVEHYEIRLYLFTLMANHVHLVLETPAGNLGRFMQSLATAYTVYFNLRHGRHGHLLDGRYKARLVEGDAYLLSLTRYVHLNPAFTSAIRRKSLEERIDHLRSYPWSSYPGYIGRRKPFPFVDETPILAMMQGPKREQRRQYRKHVESGLAQSDEEFRQALKESPLCIGGAMFRARAEQLYDALLEGQPRPEDQSFRQARRPLPAEAVLALLSEVFEVEPAEFTRRRRDSALRAAGARMLIRYGGLSQREAGQVLGMGTGAAVSRQLRRWADRLEADSGLRGRTREAEERLEDLRLGAKY